MDNIPQCSINTFLQVQEFIVNKDPTLLDNFLDVSILISEAFDFSSCMWTKFQTSCDLLQFAYEMSCTFVAVIPLTHFVHHEISQLHCNKPCHGKYIVSILT